MRNRLFHKPKLHTALDGTEKKVSWLELFYDLIFVAAIIQLGNALSYSPSLGGALAFGALFIPIWIAWTAFTFYMNRFDIDDATHRGLVFIQMFSIGAMAICLPDVMEGDTRYFALSYVGVRLSQLALHYRTHRQVPEARDLAKRWMQLLSVDIAAFTVAAFVPAPWSYIAMAIGALASLSLPVSRASQVMTSRYPPDVEHFSERYGLFTIIVLGESFVKVLTEASAKGASNDVALMAALAIAITFALWWIYFDDVAGSNIKPKKRFAPFVWVYAHLPLTVAITGTGVAIKKFLFLIPAEAAPAKYRWLLCGMLALALVSVALIDHVTQRKQSDLSDATRVKVRLGSAAFVLLFAAAGGAMPSWLFLLSVSALCIAQVAFDLVMAPLESTEPHHVHDHHQHAADLFGTADDATHPTEDTDQTKPKTVRRDFSETVRKGAPSELRRDLYFFFMEGSWTRLFATFAFTYLLMNVVFACLYLLEPGSIANTGDTSFADAFNFSIQTMSTIGYGALTPATPYGNALVAIEAGIAILGVALATGVIFAKASRPKASALFTNNLLCMTHHGERTLMFRVGNARGSEILDANCSVTVVMEEVSPEGQQMRRLYDLKLVRERSPIFAMSWTVMHLIDEESPLHGVDWTAPGDHLIAFTIILMGHDRTYSQMVSARHTYFPEDIVVDRKFADVISVLDDGRFCVDYDVFHDLEPLAAPGEDLVDTGGHNEGNGDEEGSEAAGGDPQ